MSNSKETVCAACKLDCSSIISLQKHVDQFHPAAKLFECKEDCEMAFKNYYARERHTKHQHVSASNVCEMCGISFKRRSTLKKHIYCIHTEEKDKTSFHCKHCNKTFYCKSTLTQHSLCHSQDKKYVCEEEKCGKAFR